MGPYNAHLEYRKAATETASGVSLVLACYDTLVGDMTRALAAIRNNDIQTRCKEINHAFQVLGRLELWVDIERDGDFARNLAAFYAHLRSRLLEAQLKQSPQIVEEQIDLVLTVRKNWQQQLDAQQTANAEEEKTIPASPYGLVSWNEDRVALSWSA